MRLRGLMRQRRLVMLRGDTRLLDRLLRMLRGMMQVRR
jgi:hypothetical protein